MEEIGGRDWEEVKGRFVDQLPRIEKYAAKAFSRYGPQKKEEMIHETVLNAWLGYRGAVEKGKNPDDFISKIAGYAIKRTRIDRFIDGMTNVKDVMSKRCQWKNGHAIEPLPEYSQMIGTEVTEALADTRYATPADQAAFRIDTPAWQDRFPKKKRKIQDNMIQGDSTKELAEKHKLTPGRISQLRAEFAEDYEEFHGDKVSR